MKGDTLDCEWSGVLQEFKVPPQSRRRTCPSHRFVHLQAELVQMLLRGRPHHMLAHGLHRIVSGLPEDLSETVADYPDCTQAQLWQRTAQPLQRMSPPL